MTAQLLLRQFERMSDAPDAVARLRRFILQLAVRGKLVLQDPADEHALELLRRFGPSGPSRQSREAAHPAEYEIPVSWRWCRVSDVGRVVGGGTPPSGQPGCFAASGTAIAWLTPADLGHQKGEKYASHGRRDLTPSGLDSCGATVMPAGTVLFTSRAPIGYVAIAANDVATNQGFKSVVPSAAVAPEYVAIFFQAFAPQIDAMAPGTTFREVSGKIVGALPFPLAPLAEQHRIVAKVDELMALCDQLEAAQKEREVKRDALRAASLQRLTSTDGNGATKAPDVRFFLRQSARLITKPEHLAPTRQTIVELAIRGQLVPQDTMNEPVLELLRRIPKMKGGPLSGAPAEQNAKPFEAPKGWEWIPFGTLITDSEAGWSPKTENFRRSGECWAVLKVSAVSWNNFRPEENKQLLPGVQPRLSAQVRSGDFLISRANTAELVAKAVLVTDSPRNLMLSDKIVRLRLVKECEPAYLLLVNNLAEYARSYYAKRASGASPSMKNVSREVIYELPIPFPPLAEQCRIVAKVQELIALCDQLEAALGSAQDARGRLSESLLHGALQIAHVPDVTQAG